MTNNWQKVKLGSIAYVTKLAGYEFTKFFNSYKQAGEIIVLRGKNLKLGRLDLSDIKTIGLNVSKMLPRSQLSKNDLVFSYVGTIGPVALIEENHKYHLGPNICKITPNDQIDPKFLFQYFLSQQIQDEINKKISITAQPSLSMEKIRDFEFKIPLDITDQKKIADILSSVDEAIQITEQIIQKTEGFNQGIITQLLNSSTTNVVKLNSVCLKITDGTHKTPKYLSDGIPFLRINDIQNDQINWKKCKYISIEEHNELIKRCKPEKGDVLLSKNGTIGITKVVDWDREFSIFVSLCLIKPDSSKVLPEYLSEVISSEYIMSQVRKRSKQGTVTNLHLEEIRDFDIPLPDIDRQKKVISIIKALKLKKFNEQTIYQNLIKLKTGLMNDIFNQKVEIN